MKTKKQSNYLTMHSPFLVSATLSLALHFQVQAQTTPVDDLGTSTVTASRVERSVLDSPASLSIIDSKDILERSLRTIPDALRYSSGVLIQKTTYAHGSPFIRGFTGRQNLLLVDGVRMNNSTWRSGPVQYWNTLDLNAVGKMELIKGPQSTLYGSDALGGTLNVLSRDIDYLDKKSWFHHGSVNYQFHSNSNSHIGRLEQSFGVGGKWGAMLGISGKDYGDIKDSNIGRMRRSGYREENLDFKFQYSLNPTTELTFAHQYINQDDIQRWHRLTDNPGWIHGNHVTDPGRFSDEGYDQERSLTYLRLDGKGEHSLLESWQATLSYQKSQDSTTRVDDRGRSRFGVLDVQTFGFTFQGNGSLKDGELVWGLDYYHDEVDSEGNEPRRRPIADDSSYDTLGAFAQYQFKLAEDFKVTTGVRASYFKAQWGQGADATNAPIAAGDNDWNNLSFNLGATYNLTDENVLFGSVSQGFRAPNLNDLTGSASALSGIDTIGSTNLDPEQVVSFELGFKRESNDFSLTTSVFYTIQDDPISAVTSGSTLQIVNGESGYVYGAEAEALWEFATDWTLRGSLTWQDGKQKLGSGVEDTVTGLAPFSGTASLRWTHPSDRFWVEGSIVAAATQNNLTNAQITGDKQRVPTNGTPGYLVGHLRAGYRISDALELNLAFENITDEDYRVHRSGINETGFNTILGVKYTW